MSKPKIIPYRILNSNPCEQPKLMVTNRKETKITIKPKIKSSISRLACNKGDKKSDCHPPSTANSQRPFTQASGGIRSSLTLAFKSDDYNTNSNIKQDSLQTSKSAENLIRLKGLIWDKKNGIHNISLNNSHDSLQQEVPTLNPVLISKIYNFRPFLMPFIEQMRPHREEIENLSRTTGGDFKVMWTIRETFGDRPNTREGSQLVVLKSKVYLFGGQSRIKHTDMRQLDVST